MGTLTHVFSFPGFAISYDFLRKETLPGVWFYKLLKSMNIYVCLFMSRDGAKDTRTGSQLKEYLSIVVPTKVDWPPKVAGHLWTHIDINRCSSM